MTDKKFFKKLINDYRDQSKSRRAIIAASSPVLFEAKNTIFSLHRDELKEAHESLKRATKSLKMLQNNYSLARLEEEGAYKAAVEEFTEASFLEQVISKKKLGANLEINLNYEAYLGGLCDLVGELVRLATNQAAAGKLEAPAELKIIAAEILAILAPANFTGYLRTKYDQANSHLRKLEQMAYEIRLRQNA